MSLLGASAPLQRALVRLRLDQPQHDNHGIDQPGLTDRPPPVPAGAASCP
ncbi:hypothetical protein [Blastococcus mobilis]|nr:hypothetical protein [Blastococcus mobilis]